MLSWYLDPPGGVDDAQAGAFQRHVDIGIVFHRHPSMMFGAGVAYLRISSLLTVREGHCRNHLLGGRPVTPSIWVDTKADQSTGTGND